jgi:aldose 1-epimerase
LTDEESKKNINLSHCAPNTAKTGNKSPASGEPYGFDHNYVVKHTSDSALNLAGIVEHEETMRRMTVWTDQPGVQLYTGNFLDGVALDPSFCKDSASYLQWQSICLETQTYPDSTLVSEQEFPEFAKGKCHILRPGGPSYHHTVEYRFEPIT